MPVAGRAQSVFPQRVALPRRAAGPFRALPELVGAGSAGAVRPYTGRSRFVLTPLTLSLDQLLFLITAALLCFGLIMVQSAESRIRGVHENWIAQTFSNKNAIHAGIALLVMTLFWRIDYRVFLGRTGGGRGRWGILTSPATWLAVITVGLLVAVLATPLGREFNGARRWLALGALGFQPSELAKLSLVMFVAAYAVHAHREIRAFGVSLVPVLLLLLAVGIFAVKQKMLLPVHALAFAAEDPVKFRSLQGGIAACLAAVAYLLYRRESVRAWTWGFLPLICAVGAAVVLVVKEDFGTTVLIAAVVFVMLLMAGCRWWHVFLLVPPAAVGGYVMLWHSAFRRARLLAFMNPDSDPQGAGYHVIQSLLTIVSGGLWGRGLGNGIQKMGYLPEDNTDFIFAVICEELGLVGALMVIGLFVAFVAVGWRVMSRCQNLFGKMVAFGITAIIGLQAAINIAVVTASMPTKGIALPLISSGGTGWIMNAAAIGVLMSIERINRQERDAARHVVRGAGPGQGFPVEVAVPAIPAVAATPAVAASPIDSRT